MYIADNKSIEVISTSLDKLCYDFSAFPARTEICEQVDVLPFGLRTHVWYCPEDDILSVPLTAITLFGCNEAAYTDTKSRTGLSMNISPVCRRQLLSSR